MAGSYIKVNGDIRTIDRASIKDSNGDYRIVKKVYAKVDLAGSLYWEPVLISNGLYNIVFKEDSVDIVSVENFEVEKSISLGGAQIDKIVYAGNDVYLHEYYNGTYRIDMRTLIMYQNYANNWYDIEADTNGNVYFLSNNGVSYVDIDGNAGNYNLTLQSGEEFNRFCVDKDGFCYCLTTNDRFFKINPFTQTTEYSISLNATPLTNSKLTVDNENVYFDTDFNLMAYINKTTGNELQKITNFNDEKTFKASNIQNIVYMKYGNRNISKYNISTNSSENSYAVPFGFTITDFDVSFNGNIYIAANDGTNYNIIKLNSDFQEIYNSGNIPISGNGVFKLGVFPGNFGAGFWDDYI